ncbi:MAG: chorismate synthase [Candidatus Omnitrophica bacterium]|nr:chorismate synthase [Candidatus Omnitrophota bacterium]
MLRYMTAGESHGKGFMAIIDGMPLGMRIDELFINNELSKRMHGYGRGGRMSIEKDKVQIIAGVRKGYTLGSPIGLLVENKDRKIDKLPEVKNPRPGHADLAGMQKYGTLDARDILERASARETVAKVAAGAVAKIFLKGFDIDVISHVTALGGIEADTKTLSFEEIKEFSDMKNSPLRCANKSAEKKMCMKIDQAKNEGDTLGGCFEVLVRGVPVGLGDHTQWDKRIDGNISRAMIAIPAVKAVSVGEGIDSAAKEGSKVHDPIEYNRECRKFVRTSNNAGGIEGGVTNGCLVRIKGFMKPISTLAEPLASVNITTKQVESAATERSDVTAVSACGVVAEAIVAIEIAAAFLEKFGGDSIEEIRRNYEGYLEQLKCM